MGLAVYVQCLRMVRGTRACRTVRQDPQPFGRAGPTAACAQLIRTNDWSQSGEPDWHGTPRSLFAAGSSAPRPAHRTRRVLRLPARVTLQDMIRTGSFLNCCVFGMGYVMPFSYLHLRRLQSVFDGWLGKTEIQDIELAGTAGSVYAGQPVTVSCRQLFSGQTANFGESMYCPGATITGAAASSGQGSEHCGRGASSPCRAQDRRKDPYAKSGSGLFLGWPDAAAQQGALRHRAGFTVRTRSSRRPRTEPSRTNAPHHCRRADRSIRNSAPGFVATVRLHRRRRKVQCPSCFRRGSCGAG